MKNTRLHGPVIVAVVALLLATTTLTGAAEQDDDDCWNRSSINHSGKRIAWQRPWPALPCG